MHLLWAQTVWRQCFKSHLWPLKSFCAAKTPRIQRCIVQFQNMLSEFITIRAICKALQRFIKSELSEWPRTWYNWEILGKLSMSQSLYVCNMSLCGDRFCPNVCVCGIAYVLYWVFYIFGVGAKYYYVSISFKYHCGDKVSGNFWSTGFTVVSAQLELANSCNKHN